MVDESVESKIVRALAQRVSRLLANRLISTLQKMTDALLSGGDSGLENTWDEICVQVQYEQSVYWDSYTDTLARMVEAEVASLRPYEREAIWLQTDSGMVWSIDDGCRGDHVPISAEDIVQHLTEDYIFKKAADWSNPRIRRYLDSGETW